MAEQSLFPLDEGEAIDVEEPQEEMTLTEIVGPEWVERELAYQRHENHRILRVYQGEILRLRQLGLTLYLNIRKITAANSVEAARLKHAVQAALAIVGSVDDRGKP